MQRFKTDEEKASEGRNGKFAKGSNFDMRRHGMHMKALFENECEAMSDSDAVVPNAWKEVSMRWEGGWLLAQRCEAHFHLV